MNIVELHKELQDGKITVNHKHHQINPLTVTLGQSIEHFRELVEKRGDKAAQEVGKMFFDRQIEFYKPITMGIADSLSQYCFHCGRQLYMVMTDATHLTFVETTDYHELSPEERKEGINPVHYTPCECKDMVKRGKMTSYIDIPTGNLVFANYFKPDEIYTNSEHQFEREYSLNSTFGRNSLMQYLAQKNVGYGQTGNMSVHLYVKGDGTEIIIGPRYKYDDEHRESEIVLEGFTYTGQISCEVWRWQCADKQLLDAYTDPYPASCNKLEFAVKTGKWRIEHYLDFLTEEDASKGLPYSRLKLVSEQTGKYDINSLININASFDHRHIVMQYDVDKANRYVELIERTRSNTVPKAGDRLRYTDQHGSYYPYAHIEYNRDGECYICEHPYVPFIGPEEEGIWCTSSGGAWGYLKTGDLKYIGKEMKAFKDWGNCGACANGAIIFYAEASVWEYVHPEPLFEDYTTEKWRKMYVSKLEEEDRKEHSGYLYVAKEALPSGNGSEAFRTEQEYAQFLENYKARVFPGNWYNQSVIFCYRKELTRISQTEYDTLNLPVTSIYCNGLCPAKIRHDDENKTVINYFV